MNIADSDNPESQGEKKRKGNQSLVTGFKVLDFLLQCGRPAPLREISQGTGLAPSKLQFYLISLMEVRAVHQDPRSGHYSLGPYTLQLGIAGLQQFDIFEAAQHRMDAFAKRHGHNVFLGVWGNHGPTIVHRVSGHHSQTFLELRLGSVLPVLRSALGRAFFANLPEEMTRFLVEKELREMTLGSFQPDPDLHPHMKDLSGLRSEIRENGISRCKGGLLSDHTALSAPVFDYRGKIIASVTVMGPTNSLDDSLTSSAATDLRQLALEISQEAGFTTTHYLDI